MASQPFGAGLRCIIIERLSSATREFWCRYPKKKRVTFRSGGPYRTRWNKYSKTMNKSFKLINMPILDYHYWYWVMYWLGIELRTPIWQYGFSPFSTSRLILPRFMITKIRISPCILAKGHHWLGSHPLIPGTPQYSDCSLYNLIICLMKSYGWMTDGGWMFLVLYYCENWGLKLYAQLSEATTVRLVHNCLKLLTNIWRYPF